MEDLLLHEVWKFLSYVDILILCQTSVIFNTICKDNAMWIFLLERDFDVIYTKKDARKLYLLYREALLMFTKSFPIITGTALKYIVNDIHYEKWQIIIDYDKIQHRDNNVFFNILSLNLLNMILEELKMPVPYTDSYYDDIILHIYAKQIVQKGCNELLTITSLSSIVYIYGGKKLFTYDIELSNNLCVVLDIHYDMDCYVIDKEIEKQLLAYI
jgi:hypothetical protein